VRIKAGAGQYCLTDLDPGNKNVDIGGYIFGNASGGFSIGICSFKASVGAVGGVSGVYNMDDKSIKLSGCADGYINVKACKYDTGGAFKIMMNCSYNGSFDIDGSIGWSRCNSKSKN
jgi:hypothetical protein